MKKNYWLLIIVLIALLVALFLLKTEENFDNLDKHQTTLVPAKVKSNLEKLSKVSITQNGQTITLLQQDNIWGIMDKFNYPLDLLKLRRAISNLLNSNLLSKKTNDKSRLHKLGLDTNNIIQLSLYLENNDIPDFTVNIGSSNDAQDTYVQLRNSDKDTTIQSWLASGNLSLSADTNYWLDTDIIDIKSADIHKIAISKNSSANYLVISKQQPKDRDFEVIKGDKEKLSNVNRLANVLNKLVLEDVKPISSNLDNNPLVINKIQTFDGKLISIKTTKIDEEQWVNIAVSFDKDLIVKKTIEANSSIGDSTDSAPQSKKDQGTPKQQIIPYSESEIDAIAGEAKVLNDKLNKWMYKVSSDKYKLLIGDIKK